MFYKDDNNGYATAALPVEKKPSEVEIELDKISQKSEVIGTWINELDYALGKVLAHESKGLSVSKDCDNSIDTRVELARILSDKASVLDYLGDRLESIVKRIRL